MSEVAALITAVTGLLVAMGAGMRFVWNKVEKRFESENEDRKDRLTQFEDRFVTIELHLEACRKAREIKLRVIEIIWQELKVANPTSPALVRAKKLLRDVKRVDGEI